jgi:serine/threonine protein phosphatase PrpC
MFSGVYWSIGRRQVNEDSVALEHVHTDKGTVCLCVVCDGIGSLDHGDIASGYVTECLVRWFYRTGIYLSKAGMRKIRKTLSKCLYDCHLELKSRAAEAGLNWGSTCTAVCIWNRRYICVHLGDSAAYIMNKKNMIRITSPHRNARGELIKCVGSMRYFDADYRSGRLKKGSGILIASDGFTGRLSEEELSGMLKFHGEIDDERIEKRLSKIGNELQGRGENDNRSAVYVMI